MKTISVALKAHYAQQYGTIATCWKCTLQNGTIKGFTDHDRDLAIDGVTYLAESGYTASSVETTDALNVDNLEVAGMLVSPAITEADLRAGLWDFAAVEIFRVNWADLSQGREYVRVGHLGEVSAGRGQFTAELRGLMQHFSRVIGQLTSPSCRASLGDARCQVNLASHTVTGTLTGVAEDNCTLFDTSRVEAGPAASYALDLVQVDGVRTLISAADAPHLLAGAPIALHGVDGCTLVNGLHRVREPTAAPLPFVFYVDVDISDQPAWGGNGSLTPLGATSGHFDFGVITFTSGLNTGLSMEVRQYVPGQITLVLPMPYACAIGDDYELVAGCDKLHTTCQVKFSNLVNFRGEPHVPGVDKAVQVGRRG